MWSNQYMVTVLDNFHNIININKSSLKDGKEVMI